jgi:transposase
LVKIIWHDGQGACLFTKRLERGRFLWPSLADGVVNDQRCAIILSPVWN